MIEIPIEEYETLIDTLMKAKELLQTWKLLWFVYIIISSVYLFILIDRQPDKETRKRIKALAKDKKVQQYQIVNGILKSYFDISDLSTSRKLHLENHFRTYEEWKAEKEKKLQGENQDHKQIVKPRKKVKE